ncbi:MAG: hypothetical protein GYA24_04505 [Candidatus Lokiarchaeota archaeon]|nr:hypothetical protein [Candidatus Lokiarchaeota archaeon]
MKLYDLEAFVHNKRAGAGTPRDEVVLDDVTFKVVLDENIIPPLEILEGKAYRELILTRQRVFAQKHVEYPPIQAELHAALVDEARGAGPTGQPGEELEQPADVEYEDLGTLPEGACLFRDEIAFLHIDKRGRVQQIDLVKKRSYTQANPAPMKKEFSKMLIQDVKAREWDDLVGHFLKNE